MFRLTKFRHVLRIFNNHEWVRYLWSPMLCTTSSRCTIFWAHQVKLLVPVFLFGLNQWFVLLVIAARFLFYYSSQIFLKLQDQIHRIHYKDKVWGQRKEGIMCANGTEGQMIVKLLKIIQSYLIHTKMLTTKIRIWPKFLSVAIFQ